MWDERYSRPDYLFGTEPAAFLTDHADFLVPGARALAVADGEGRNSVFMASRGLAVTAMDASAIGLEKARALAKARGQKVDFVEADIAHWDWTPERFDLVAAIFIQFMGPDLRDAVFAGLKRTLKPGGVLLLHGYTPKQIEYGTGGPGRVENLYTPEMLDRAFGDLDILRLEAYDRRIEEGAGHSGISALVDLVARKPERD